MLRKCDIKHDISRLALLALAFFAQYAVSEIVSVHHVTMISPETSSLRFAVLECPPLCNEIITFLVKGTDWNDSIAFRRITTMLIRLFRELNQVPEFVPFFAKNVFEIALNSLVSQSSWTTDSQAELLNIMSEIYFTYAVYVG